MPDSDFGGSFDEGLQRRAAALQEALSQLDADDVLASNYAKIRLFGSNHFRRWQQLDHLAFINSPASNSNEAPFRFETFQPTRPKCAVFIGDSHAEFGCRLPVVEPLNCDYSSFNYWLGPVTMMGVLTNPGVFQAIVDAISKAKELHGGATKRSVILSFGEIDARHVIYQFILKGKFACGEDYVAFLRPLLQGFLSRLAARFPDHAFFMLQPIPTSDVMPYSSPTDVAEMDAYYQQFGDYLSLEQKPPSLGSPCMRRDFWRCMDGMASEICASQSVRYLPLPPFVVDNGYLNPKHTCDNTHASSREALEHQECLHDSVLFAA